MKNYWLDYSLETYGKELRWDWTRIGLLESLVKSAAKFSVELSNHLGRLSPFDYGSILENHGMDLAIKISLGGGCIQACCKRPPRMLTRLPY